MGSFSVKTTGMSGATGAATIIAWPTTFKLKRTCLRISMIARCLTSRCAPALGKSSARICGSYFAFCLHLRNATHSMFTRMARSPINLVNPTDTGAGSTTKLIARPASIGLGLSRSKPKRRRIRKSGWTRGKNISRPRTIEYRRSNVQGASGLLRKGT